MTVHSTDLPFFGGSFDVSMGSQLAWGIGFCLLWAVLIELWLKLNVPWLAMQPLWKGGAQAVQRKLLNNFGFPSEPTPPKFPVSRAPQPCHQPPPCEATSECMQMVWLRTG